MFEKSNEIEIPCLWPLETKVFVSVTMPFSLIRNVPGNQILHGRIFTRIAFRLEPITTAMASEVHSMPEQTFCWHFVGSEDFWLSWYHCDQSTVNKICVLFRNTEIFSFCLSVISLLRCQARNKTTPSQLLKDTAAEMMYAKVDTWRDACNWWRECWARVPWRDKLITSRDLQDLIDQNINVADNNIYLCYSFYRCHLELGHLLMNRDKKCNISLCE